MPQEMLEQRQALEPIVLTEVVQQDQRSADFELTDWTVDRLSSTGIANPDWLFRFSGHGRVGQVVGPWSVALKIIPKPGDDQDPRALWYWKRELLAAQSHLLTRLPGSVVAPRIYAMSEHEDCGWLWMEYIEGSANQRWALANYGFAARELGRFNGAYLTGTPIPDYPWLCAEHCRAWLATAQRDQPENVWDNPFVRGAVTGSARPRVERVGYGKYIHTEMEQVLGFQ